MFLVEYFVFRFEDVATVFIECHVDRSATPLPAYIVTPFDQRACRRVVESVRGPIASSTLYPEDYGFLNSHPPPSGVVKGVCLRKIVFVEMSKRGGSLQPVDATHSLNRSAGVWKSSVFRGRSLS